MGSGQRGLTPRQQLEDPVRWRIVELSGQGGSWLARQQLADPATDRATQSSSIGKESLRPLIENTCGGWGGRRRNSLHHRRVPWRDPQGPRTYTNPSTWESAPEGPNLLVGSRGSDWKPTEREQMPLLPIGPSSTYSVTAQPPAFPRPVEHLRLRPLK